MIRLKKIISIILIMALSFGIIENVFAGASTLGDLKNELIALKNQKATNDASKNKTQAEINAENNKIADAHSQVEQAENDIAIAENSIEESNANIDKTKEESKKLLVFYQVMQGENSFIEYVSGASNMTDLMMRADSVSQILTYNEETLKSMELEIEKNEDLQVELAKKQEELKSKIVTYESSLLSLKNDLSSLVEVSLDINAQIKAQQELIEYYEEIGCKDDQELSACVDIASSTRWLKPTNRGYISSGFGYRSFYLNGRPYSDYHNAVDVAGNAGGTNIYAAANGTVAAVIYRASCGGNQVYIHARVGGVAYTITYAHMMDVYVNVGDKVTQSDVIGTVGGGGITLRVNGGWDTCSTGYHLHFGVARGFYLGGGSEGYTSYSKYVAQSIMPPMMPGYGNWYYSRY